MSKSPVNRHSSIGIPRRSRRGGFALLITITLLAFLVLLLVSLASLTRVETQVAGNSQNLAQARQNALLALNIAIGQLQLYTGPDQRVTATADVQPVPAGTSKDPASGTDLTGATSAVANSIDTYWLASRNRRWTGTWKNGNTTTYDKDAPMAFNPAPELENWLVSGNETTPASFKPSDQISGLTLAAVTASGAANTAIADASGRPYRLLVGVNTAGVSAAADLDRAVVAPQVEIKSTTVPGTNGASTPVGHYAWWVGDEGVKARANLVDPYHEFNDPAANHTTRFQSAQRPAVEAMTTTGADGLAALDPADQTTSSAFDQFNKNLLKTFNPAQLAYVTSAATLPAELKARYHDLSVSSRGVLADVRHGGLKSDLSYLLGQPNVAAFRTALKAVYNDPSFDPTSTNNTDAAGADTSANPVFLNPTGTIYATLPTDAALGQGYNKDHIFAQAATWEQLWSFNNMGNLTTDTPAGVYNASGQAVPRRHTAVQHGLYPLIIQAKIFYRLRIVGGTADPDGVNRTGILYVDTIPVALLANPYSVPLGPADYQLVLGTGGAALVYRNPPDPDHPDSPDDTDNPSAHFTRFYSTEPDYNGKVAYVLRSSTGIAPGEARIFTIDPDPSANPGVDSDGHILLTGSNDARQVVMTDDYYPVPALSFNTGKTIPAAATRAAMWSGASSISSKLYMGYVAADGDKNLAQSINPQGVTTGVGGVDASNRFLIVNPIDGNNTRIWQGGGYNLVLNQPPTTANPYNTLFNLQQAPFYQVNYRAMTVNWTANSAINHPLEWARSFSKNGSTGSAGNAPNPWLAANLMRPSGSTTTARWGIVNIGEGQEQTVAPDSIGGPGAGNVGFNNDLYDIPLSGRHPVSLGELQHFNTAGFMSFTNSSGLPQNIVNSWQVNYPLSNSYPEPRIPRDRVFYVYTSPNPNNHNDYSMGYQFDGSYLWNDLLWDRFYFSSYPQSGAFDFAADKLVNARHRPFRDRGRVPWNDPANFRGNGNPATADNSRLAAQNLLVDGAFNINSTSVEAWKALFSSLKNVPVSTATTPNAPFARILAPTGGSANTKTGTDVNSWTGFRDLSLAEITSLAQEMVRQIRARGPFLSLADFVNRRLSDPTKDPLSCGLKGALQTAIDNVTNLKNDVSSAFAVTTLPYNSNPGKSNTFGDPFYIMSTGLAGFPGYLLQADLLSPLGSVLSARSDTFTIRTYGDAVNPATGDVTGRAWCEALVQRTPDYVGPAASPGGNAPTDLPATLGATNAAYGRRYQIVSFRWLGPSDI